MDIKPWNGSIGGDAPPVSYAEQLRPDTSVFPYILLLRKESGVTQEGIVNDIMLTGTELFEQEMKIQYLRQMTQNLQLTAGTGNVVEILDGPRAIQSAERKLCTNHYTTLVVGRSTLTRFGGIPADAPRLSSYLACCRIQSQTGRRHVIQVRTDEDTMLFLAPAIATDMRRIVKRIWITDSSRPSVITSMATSELLYDLSTVWDAMPLPDAKTATEEEEANKKQATDNTAPGSAADASRPALGNGSGSEVGEAKG